jgi:hypothetical protein
MTYYTQREAFFFLNGYNGLAAMLSGLRHKVMVGTQSIGAPVGHEWDRHKRNGTKSVEIVQEGGYFLTDEGNIHDVFVELSGAGGADPNIPGSVICFGAGGTVQGSYFLGAEGGLKESYEALSKPGPSDSLTRANATHKVSGKAEFGVVLHERAEVSDSDTESTPVDNALDPNDVAISITSSSVANPTVVTTAQPHKLTTGDTVIIAGHTGASPTINGERTVTVVTPTTFTVAVNVTVGGTGGTFKRGKTNAGGAGYIQVLGLDLADHTHCVVKIRDAAVGTFADLVTFTNIDESNAPDGRFAGRVEVAGAVDRNLAVSVAFEGGSEQGSIDLWVGFTRFSA